MNTKAKFTAAFLVLAASAVAPVVIGRHGGVFADLLRVEVLFGLGIVATLVALITLEYGRGANRTALQPATLRLVNSEVAQTVGATVVALPKDEETRAAA